MHSSDPAEIAIYRLPPVHTIVIITANLVSGGTVPLFDQQAPRSLIGG